MYYTLMYGSGSRRSRTHFVVVRDDVQVRSAYYISYYTILYLTILYFVVVWDDVQVRSADYIVAHPFVAVQDDVPREA